MKRIKTGPQDVPGKSAREAVSADTGAGGEPARLCVICRCMRHRQELIRLTVDHKSGALAINEGKNGIHGRSAYLCKTQACVTQAQKSGKLKGALEGRKGKNLANRRSVKWPLEPQLIQDILQRCSEP